MVITAHQWHSPCALALAARSLWRQRAPHTQQKPGASAAMWPCCSLTCMQSSVSIISHQSIPAIEGRLACMQPDEREGRRHRVSSNFVT